MGKSATIAGILPRSWNDILVSIVKRGVAFSKTGGTETIGFDGFKAMSGSIRPVFYAALLKGDAELERLQDKVIISSVQFSNWATAIVVARKADNLSVRVCGDYSTSPNDALESDCHPLPNPEASWFPLSRNDLSDVYFQVEVEEESRKMLTVNTHQGLFNYNRLPPGIKSTPGAFQRIIDSITAVIPGV
ncbi:uncharacterized protein K02A2.6-like [Toxorhynchites rutilus septentrionalis]|uniref:uncharacterized protein K02A2.6-like n=1 Tax=Toxorhynchites rutilus septentrionalis TaxID=329112 RepID=UPI0024784272|nr:uncharacterized protein K02A2.6-like [Toxorhynchites rutilus septentrionalis]